MLARGTLRIGLGLLLVIASIALGCARQSSPPVSESVRQKVEEPDPSPPPAERTEGLGANEMAKLPPPKPAEVKDATSRVFKDAAVLDTSQEPYFLVGDFNGDHSQDIAVIVKAEPAKLSELNQEFPPWMLKDPLNPSLPPQLRKEPLRVEENDRLMAVIHGYGPKGWRDSEATQTYLLKGAVGVDIKIQTPRVALAPYSAKRVPDLVGDTITQVLAAKPGFIYYSGATYAWYDPNTYKPGAERRVAHSGTAVRP